MNGCHQSVARLPGSCSPSSGSLQPLILTLLVSGCRCSAILLVAPCGLCRFGWRPMLCASPFSLLLLYRLFKYVYLYTVITYIPKPIVSAVKVWFSGAGASAAHLNRGVASGRETPPWSSHRYRPRLKPHSDDARQNSWLVIIVISIIKIAYYAGVS